MDIKKASELFWTTFIGEYVEILCMSKKTPGEGKEDFPFVMHGYLLDIDDSYYYLGVNSIEVSSAIKKNIVDYVTIIEQIDQATEILENMPAPQSEGDVN